MVCRRDSGFALGVIFFAAQAHAALREPVELKIDQPFSQEAGKYATLGMTHYTATFYDANDYRASQTPSFETKGRFGLRLYRGILDTFAEVGMVKFAETQKVEQKRSRLGASYYPASGELGEIQFYTQIDLPFSEAKVDEEAKDPHKQGAIITLGFSPTLSYEFNANGGPLALRLGGDLWTRLYSRAQALDANDVDGADFDLVKKVESEEVEDKVMTIDDQIRFGGYWSPNYIRRFFAEIMMIYDNHHYPFYYTVEGEGEDPDRIRSEYKTKRLSRLRLRGAFKISPHLFVRNDFYQLYEGFYRAEARLPEVRMLNMLQLAYNF